MKGVYYPSLQSFANISKAHEQAIKTCENRTFRFECSGKTLHENWYEYAFINVRVASGLTYHINKAKCKQCLRQLNELYHGRFSFYQSPISELITVVELDVENNPEKRLPSVVTFHSSFIFKKNGNGTVSVLKDRRSLYPEKTLTHEELKKELPL